MTSTKRAIPTDTARSIKNNLHISFEIYILTLSIMSTYSCFY